MWLAAILSCASVFLMADTTPPRLPVVGIPAYFYPAPGDDHWNRLLDAADGIIVIINPASGPGSVLDPAYLSAATGLQQRHGSVYGYVDTAYGQRSLKAVLQDAERYRRWYHVDGIFLDQTELTAARLPYYRALSEALHADRLQVAMNPGQPQIDRRYLELAEHIVLFEGTYDSYLSTRFAHWVKSYQPSKIWNLVYGVPDAAAMARVLRLAGSRNAGVIFATDGLMVNPWKSLPPYWELERRATVGGLSRV